MNIETKVFAQGDIKYIYINSNVIKNILHIDKSHMKKIGKLIKEDNNEYIIFNNRDIYISVNGFKKLLNMTPRFDTVKANTILKHMITKERKIRS